MEELQLFNALFGCYFTTVYHILKEAKKRELTDSDYRNLIGENAELYGFQEISRMLILDAITLGENEELEKNKYITERTAIFFKMLFSIIERQLYLKIHNEKITISSNVQLLDYLKFSLLNREIEVFKVLFLNTRNELLKEEELFKGTIDRSTVYIRELIKKILNYNAKSVILVHNHPAGSLKPSQADIALTRKIKEIFEGIEIRLLDHIIISEKGYFSFLEGGIL